MFGGHRNETHIVDALGERAVVSATGGPDTVLSWRDEPTNLTIDF